MESESVLSRIPSNLVKLRKSHGITQTQLGKVLNMTRQGYTNIEKGKAALTLENATKLALFYKVSIEELISLPIPTNSFTNECSFSTFVEKENAIIESSKLLKIDNFQQDIYIVKDKNGDLNFYQSTISPCYDQVMLFYHNGTLKNKRIFKYSSVSFAYVEGNIIVRVPFKACHFIAVKTDLKDIIQ